MVGLVVGSTHVGDVLEEPHYSKLKAFISPNEDANGTWVSTTGSGVAKCLERYQSVKVCNLYVVLSSPSTQVALLLANNSMMTATQGTTTVL